MNEDFMYIISGRGITYAKPSQKDLDGFKSKGDVLINHDVRTFLYPVGCKLATVSGDTQELIIPLLCPQEVTFTTFYTVSSKLALELHNQVFNTSENQ